jgi:CRISPR-associated endonuclease/helicase Cas3
MIEAVYGEAAERLPMDIERAHLRARGVQHGESTLGLMNVIDPSDGYGGVRIQDASEDVGTRLGEPTTTLRLARRENGRLVPWSQEPLADESLRWALSEVTVRRRWLGEPAPEPAAIAVVDAARALWPEWERTMPLYEVTTSGALSLLGREPLVYDVRTGLTKVR